MNVVRVLQRGRGQEGCDRTVYESAPNCRFVRDEKASLVNETKQEGALWLHLGVANFCGRGPIGTHVRSGWSSARRVGLGGPIVIGRDRGMAAFKG